MSLLTIGHPCGRNFGQDNHAASFLNDNSSAGEFYLWKLLDLKHLRESRRKAKIAQRKFARAES